MFPGSRKARPSRVHFALTAVAFCSRAIHASKEEPPHDAAVARDIADTWPSPADADILFPWTLWQKRYAFSTV